MFHGAGVKAQTLPAEVAPAPSEPPAAAPSGEPAAASAGPGVDENGAPPVGASVSPYPGPSAAAPSSAVGVSPSGPPSPPLLSPVLPTNPMSAMALQRYRTGRALYGVGTAFGLVGSGLTLASIVVTSVYGLGDSADPSKVLIGPSLAYAGSAATGAGFIFGATGLGLQHSALATIGQDPGRGIYAVGTLLGILGLGGIGASYFFGLTNYVDNSTTIAFGTSIAASVLLTVGGLLCFSDQTRVGAVYRRLTTF